MRWTRRRDEGQIVLLILVAEFFVWPLSLITILWCTQSCTAWMLLLPPLTTTVRNVPNRPSDSFHRRSSYNGVAPAARRRPPRRRCGGLFESSTRLSSDWNNDVEPTPQQCLLESVLRDSGFGPRLRTLSALPLPVSAEIYVDGQIVVAQITSILFSNDASLGEPPKVTVEYPGRDKSLWTSIVDFGQITTIWDDHTSDPKSWNAEVIDAAVQKLGEVAEPALDRLYQSHLGRARSSNSALTKKQVARMVPQFEANAALPPQPHAETVLRKVLKAGTGFARLVDSSMVAAALFDSIPRRHGPPPPAMRQAVAARLLAQDAARGGRFKRWPCIYVGSSSYVNGGWMATDQSVRAGTEARKFVERSSLGDDTVPQTVADERIARRLECLAMGELLASDNDKNNHEDRRLELDVRETLKAMNLPSTSEGAKRALVQAGHWSGDEAKHESLSRTIQTWSRPILEAAKWYADRVERNRSRMMEGRVDLTKLPCISVDAKKAAFRDDAIGVRPRADTGRKFVPEASNWEILIHIADVSDIYSIFDKDKHTSDNVSVLREAAASRGMSRYDLPHGPLHLLPPLVLRAVAFPDDGERRCRCVTLWAYIDERDGRLLDTGIERTTVSSPIKFSFTDANAVMEENVHGSMDKARAILLVVERNLNKWSDNQRQWSEVARKREARLAARETVAQTLPVPIKNEQMDDGTAGFRRTRAHRLVDTALDLYANTAAGLLRRAKAPVPRVIGADESRGGRVATAPLRRYVDGQAQRQLLAVFCDYGRPMSFAECKEAAQVANKARNSISNVRSIRKN